jgi:hypothetical protein
LRWRILLASVTAVTALGYTIQALTRRTAGSIAIAIVFGGAGLVVAAFLIRSARSAGQADESDDFRGPEG